MNEEKEPLMCTNYGNDANESDLQICSKNTEVSISGFWRRVFAFILDGAILGIFGLILGLVFGHQFATMGSYARVIGFLVSVTYFGVLNSTIGNGQTLGKRIVGIKVVGENGETISLFKSFERASILFVPWYLDILVPLSTSTISTIISSVIGFVGLGFGLGTVYLILFNRKNRQVPHDLVLKTFVVRAGIVGDFSPSSTAKLHYIVLGILICLVIASGILFKRTLTEATFSNMNIAYKELLKMDNVLNAGVNSSFIFGPDGRIEHISAQVIMKKYEPKNQKEVDELTKKVAKIILEKYPDARNKDYIGVRISYGYNIGIWSWTRSYTDSKTPSDWQKKLRQ